MTDLEMLSAISDLLDSEEAYNETNQKPDGILSRIYKLVHPRFSDCPHKDWRDADTPLKFHNPYTDPPIEHGEFSVSDLKVNHDGINKPTGHVVEFEANDSGIKFKTKNNMKRKTIVNLVTLSMFVGGVFLAWTMTDAGKMTELFVYTLLISPALFFMGYGMSAWEREEK